MARHASDYCVFVGSVHCEVMSVHSLCYLLSFFVCLCWWYAL